MKPVRIQVKPHTHLYAAMRRREVERHEARLRAWARAGRIALGILFTLACLAVFWVGCVGMVG